MSLSASSITGCIASRSKVSYAARRGEDHGDLCGGRHTPKTVDDRAELNPEERLNADLKQALYTKVPVRTKAKLKAATAEYMETLEGSPERVKSYFQDPSLQLLTSAKLRIGVVVGVIAIFGGDES